MTILRRGQRPFGSPFTLNRSSPQAEGLTLWYPHADYPGGGVLRERIHGLNGPPEVTEAARPGWVSTAMGPATNYDGVGTRFEFPDNLILRVPTVTISAWVFLTANAQASGPLIFGKNWGTSGRTSYGLRLLTDPMNAIRFTTHWGPDQANIATTVGATGMALNTWYHVACTTDLITNRVYLNGRQDGSLAETRAINYTTLPFTFGEPSDPVNRRYVGRLTDVRVYNRPLSAAEVWQLYDPATRYDLYLPAARIFPSVSVGGATLTITIDPTTTTAPGIRIYG